ncbi:glycosyltransferase [Streptococcus suis]|uniref:Putative glycosyl transferase n=1 Tax=Streptococcus suis TaxID=1307 RepID=A0A123UEM5_STRSU|nr:glycosyltransferase [Streptococcus suis]NQG29030.1 multidrug MFS transporter [Streptococcus suis]NQN95383.1 multidrug MFS transporter [Streptococcus suis]NQO34374.1 multidrug MFS transporter [Streptococcus suis]NQO43499.1 multidrug MFS transporter [Streptococcus suis]NQO54118.1 multidrug MFS transporter [Streptococcus suis]
MIFVTVGTHEQQFNRLIKEIDLLKKNGSITDEIFIQTGFSTYEPKYCTWKNLLSYSEMEDYMLKADIVVTHGGPASFMDAMSKGKTTIVVPRQKKYGEHVNDHQLEFCKKIVEKGYELTMVKDVSDLKNYLNESNFQQVKLNHQRFIHSFIKIIDKLLEK